MSLDKTPSGIASRINYSYMIERGIKGRVSTLFKSKGINVNRASKILGIPQRTLNRQVNEDGNVGMELVYALIDNYPDVSPLWLLLGEGEMLLDGNAVPKCASMVPYYNNLPVSAGLRDNVDQFGEKPSQYISIPMQGAEFYFPVLGTSMEPEINDGDIVGVKRVSRSEGINHGDVYMVITNDTRMIKRCYHDNNDPDLIWCVSPNYPSFPIHKNDVCALFRVVNRIESF